MLILGIDTSGRQGSVALLEAQGGVQNETLLTLECAPLGGGQYSEVLVSAIAALLLRHGLQKRSLALIAVASGPGSFTGLRVAIATAKGLAEALAIPVVPVSVLEAILLASGAQGRAVAAIDAQRGEVFFGEFSVLGESIVASAAGSAPSIPENLREGIASFADFVSALASASPPPKVFTPDEGLAGRLRDSAIRDSAIHDSAIEVALVTRPSAQDIARIAHRKFLAGVRADVATLDANYLRRSDAEIFSAPKLGLLRSLLR
jgi:tRNA threonylcarbamoyladenosine biosynthesis protein TsaB